MERQIKFRGFGSGKWRYGYYVHFDEKPLSVIYNPKFRDFIISQGKYGEHAIPVDPETVGQFTGLHDKNGKMIFEGDVFDIGGMLRGEITWHPDGYWCIKDDYEHIGDKSHRPLGEMIDYAIQRNYKYEVVGNVHEQNYQL